MKQQYPLITEQEEAKTFLNNRGDEDSPIEIDEELNKRYYNLEQIFNTFYPSNSLTIARTQSKCERASKRLLDKSFVYGEIVNYHIML